MHIHDRSTMPFLNFAIPRLLSSRACYGMCSRNFLRRMGIFHVIHCLLMAGVIGVSMVLGGVISWNPFQNPKPMPENSWEEYGGCSIILYLCRYLTLLAVPQAIATFLGLLLYNAFPETPKLKKTLLSLPVICFRVVTKGDYPELVRNNIERNINICRDAGLHNFLVEVVTDKSISLVSSDYKKEIVVPADYATKSGALYKARALQYCLEDEVSSLQNEDWIVHLDEETILTSGVVHGIMNFIAEGRHQFGQGVITYANEEIVSYFLTLCDTVRVADDMGKYQFQLRFFEKPLFGWKGSFVVANVGAEKEVTFDNGRDSSVCEDTFFGLVGASLGYSFGFVEGEMWEKSPFDVGDFLRQRKRWLQGLLLVVHSSRIPLRYRLLLGIGIYAWVTMPLTTANMILQPFFPIYMPKGVDFAVCFTGAIFTYMYIYGVCRSFSIRRVGVFKFVVLMLTGILVTPFKILVENIAVIWGIVTPKHKFDVVKKSLTSETV